MANEAKVSRSPKVSMAKEELDWPWEISIKISRYRPKVAFLSGEERGYYPEDPGHSKFGLTYCLPVDENPHCNYTPSTNLLNKPISTLGYGIGGLLAERFPPLVGEDTPAPNEYQAQLLPPRVKKSERPVRIKWTDFVQEYEEIAERQCAKYDADLAHMHTIVRGTPGRKSMEVKSIKKDHRSTPDMQRKRRLKVDKTKERAKLCPKNFSAFGMAFGNSRFPNNEGDGKIGVGTYEVNTPALKQSFRITTPEGKLIPRVRIVCHPDGADQCMVCYRELYFSDYYQTKEKYKVLNTVDPRTEGKYKMAYLSMCRDCYCTALKEGYPPWPKDKIPATFMKARHCNSVHDHQEGHQQFLMKSTCKGLRNLARREIAYSRYFKDNPCEEKSR